MNISGHTQPFAVLGHPIGHTLSPVMHNAAFQTLGRDALYLAFDVRPDHLAAVLPAMRQMGFGGANLTVPLKETALSCLDRIDDSARLLGAVNTVRFDPDGTTGFNTDGAGFLAAVEEAFGRSVTGASLFVLGTGGAGRAIALTCAGAGAGAIALTDNAPHRARAVAREIESHFTLSARVAVDPAERIASARAADLIVQATPIGMKIDDPLPLDPAAFRPGQFAFDLIYMYPQTAFMKAAAAAGAQTANGLGMLLHQGARAFEIWTGIRPPVEVMRRALEQDVYKT